MIGTYRSATHAFSFHNKLFIILQTSAQILLTQTGLAHRLRARLKATLSFRCDDLKSICRCLFDESNTAV